MSSIKDTFFEECEELLEALSEGLSAIQEGAHDNDRVNAVFRAVHSIKGGAGAFGLDELVSFSHAFENVLDCLRSEKLAFTDELIDLLVHASDQLADLVESSRDERETDGTIRAKIVEKLETYLDEEDEEVELNFQPMGVAVELDISAEPEEPETYVIQFCPQTRLYQNGHEPLFLLRALEDLGDVSVSVITDDLPPLIELDPSAAYLGWNITLKTHAPVTSIESIFEFVEGLCELQIIPQTQSVEPVLAVESPQTQDVKPSLGTQATPEPEPKNTEAKPVAASNTPRPTLRVDLGLVDRLINTVGELIINQAMLTQQVKEIEDQNVRDIESQLEDYRTLARDLQEGVMAIRAQPVKPLFQRMARIVREAASATSKSAKLTMVGETTEVDKTVIERLTDPLTHMIRNAVDHGLETTEGRRAAGKDEVGSVCLSASHRSGSVYIEISDDGAGLNREKIYKIAVEKGLIQDGVELSDSEVDHLLFLPGFSTATEVSNLSGRGVGMDVVKNAVNALGGRVSIASVPGEGTTFSVVLPLTLAVMDGMVIQVAEQTMVVPIAPIVETIQPTHDSIHSLGSDGPLLSIRGKFVPIIDVGAQLGLAAKDNLKLPETLLLVETESIGQCALSVDTIIDQRQIVIKSLDGVYGNIQGVSAATILGDGRIAMILDPDGIAGISPRTQLSA